VYNGLAAAAAAITLGVPFQTVIDSLYNAPGVKGRAEIVPTGKDFTVIIDYAHTPDGLENICSTLKECAAGRLVTVFGCGGDRDRTKRPLMGAIAANLSDFVIVTSDNPRSEDPAAIIKEIVAGMQDVKTPYQVIENRTDAIHFAIKNARQGDTILLAGKGHETYQILKTGTIHLDEREIIAEALIQL
jgi:UDP-N-acetylmuramoyl-L-alanyl-D-glutamate--2,6-diaminopimelate ligase